MSSSDAGPGAGRPFEAFEQGLRLQAAAASPASGLSAPITAVLDGGRLPIVFPAHVVEASVGGALGTGSSGRDWLVGELSRSFGGRSAAAWHAAVDTDLVTVVVLDEPGFDPPPLPELGANVTRVALPQGHTARHVRSPWPLWVRVVTFVLLASGIGVLAWSYAIATWQAALLGIAVGAVFARLGPYPPLRRWQVADLASWGSLRRVAQRGALLFGAVGLLVGVLAIDGLSARDAALVIVPLVLGGAWIGGGDLLAVMAHHGRGRTVADLGCTRVLERRGPFSA